MQTIYLLLILIYSTLPPLSLYFTQKLIFVKKEKYGWHIHYLLKYFITLTFLPLLFFSDIDLALIPRSYTSLLFIFATTVLAIVGLQFALKQKVLMLYVAGVYAAFMEEILFRGVIYGLSMAIWNDWWLALIISSFTFGIWHLKNFPWHQNHKRTWIQFLYTSLGYGPVFALMRIWSGDIYLGVLFHFITDATVALAPDWMRGQLVARLHNNSKDS